MKCDRCGYDDKGTGDFAHVCSMSDQSTTERIAEPVHVCPACQGEPAKPALAFFNTGEDYTKHYAAEVTMPCRVCEGTGAVNGWVLLRHHKGRKHRADRVERGETLLHAAQRLGVSSAELSAYEHGYADLPNAQATASQEDKA